MMLAACLLLCFYLFSTFPNSCIEPSSIPKSLYKDLSVWKEFYRMMAASEAMTGQFT